MSQASLLETVQKHIAFNGPISVAEYMTLCLLDPNHGYYTQANPFGAQGDFTTAPEISQLFGEIVGAWLINSWHQMGKPDPFLLVEAGPGRGTLMRDIWRTAQLDTDFRTAANPALIEASPRLQAEQQQTLKEPSINARWLANIEELPSLPSLIVSNEFFDAIPIRQFIRQQDLWLERVVGLGPNKELRWQIGTAHLSRDRVSQDIARADNGSILEVSTAREAIAATMAAHIAKNGGVALHFDYGHTSTAPGDTFQAVHRHQFVDVLDMPGQADLTSHVNFQALAHSAKAAGVHTYPVMEQGVFLVQCGLLERAGQFGAQKTPEQQQQIRADVQRLAGNGPNEMGALFKAFCFAHPDVPALAPFSG